MKINPLNAQNFCALKYSKNEYSKDAFKRYGSDPGYCAYIEVLDEIDCATPDRSLSCMIYKDKDGDILLLHSRENNGYSRCYSIKRIKQRKSF